MHVDHGETVRCRAGSAKTAAGQRRCHRDARKMAAHRRRSVSFDHSASAPAIVGERRRTSLMTLPRLRELCLSMPGATEQIQWGKDLVFKVGGKMFCVACTDPIGPEIAMSFKCDARRSPSCASARASSRRPTWRARSGWRSSDSTRCPIASSSRWSRAPIELIKAKLPKKDAGRTDVRNRRKRRRK